MKVLMVLTSHDRLGNTGRKTGFWLEEMAAPYYVFKEAGAQITCWAIAARSPRRSLQRHRRGAGAQPSPQEQPVAQRDLCVVARR
jgi:putative intracellular protease/amidase